MCGAPGRCRVHDGRPILSRVRPLRKEDIDRVLTLWGHLGAEDIDLISYDRWGPGVPVPARPDIAEVEALTTDPHTGVTALLEDMLSAASPHFCHVAEVDGEPVGFVTVTVGAFGLFEDRAGRIDDLFVLPAYRRRGLATELVDAAVAELGRRGVVVYNVEVPHDWREGLAFWRGRRHWKQDAVVFSRYD